MKVRIKWLDNMSFVGESGSGHSVVMDGSPDNGGRDLGVRPMEMVLMGLGGCTAFDIVLILQRARQAVEDCAVHIEAERADAIPAVFTKIHVEFEVVGKDLSEKQVARAVDMSAEKYCSVSKMLEHSVEMTHSYKIVEKVSS
ncbi:OsmC family protein [gamma proteobacterium HTCC5015]|nr:OsmC family protein [gamma proteobacterium HTCC5015]